MALCPALTSHSELSEQALGEAGITPTTVRVAVGDEHPRFLLEHLTAAAHIAMGDVAPEFVSKFPDPHVIDAIYKEVYLDVHKRRIAGRCQRPRPEEGQRLAAEALALNPSFGPILKTLNS